MVGKKKKKNDKKKKSAGKKKKDAEKKNKHNVENKSDKIKIFKRKNISPIIMEHHAKDHVNDILEDINYEENLVDPGAKRVKRYAYGKKLPKNIWLATLIMSLFIPKKVWLNRKLFFIVDYLLGGNFPLMFKIAMKL